MRAWVPLLIAILLVPIVAANPSVTKIATIEGACANDLSWADFVVTVATATASHIVPPELRNPSRHTPQCTLTHDVTLKIDHCGPIHCVIRVTGGTAAAAELDIDVIASVGIHPNRPDGGTDHYTLCEATGRSTASCTSQFEFVWRVERGTCQMGSVVTHMTDLPNVGGSGGGRSTRNTMILCMSDFGWSASLG